MNTEIRFILLHVIVAALAWESVTIDVLAQATDCNGDILECPRTKKYPYMDCFNQIVCKGYDDIPILGVKRGKVPMCVTFETFSGPTSIQMPAQQGGTVEVYNAFHAQTDADWAMDEWNCICNAPRGTGCCLKVRFSTNSGDFIDERNDLAVARSNGCFRDCNNTVIIFNNTPNFKWPSRQGVIDRFFYTGPFVPPVSFDLDKKVYSLRTVLIHELQHYFGLPHFREKDRSHCPPYSYGSVVGHYNVSPNASPATLSNDDKCRFAILYCSLVVPVTEDFGESTDDLSSAPNPFSNVAWITFELEMEAEVYIAVYDARGQLVRIVESSRLGAGEYTREFESGGLPSGQYWCRLMVDGETQTEKMILVR